MIYLVGIMVACLFVLTFAWFDQREEVIYLKGRVDDITESRDDWVVSFKHQARDLALAQECIARLKGE